MSPRPARKPSRRPATIRRCLICTYPGPHKPGPRNGYLPHRYDPGERRTEDRGRAARTAPTPRAGVTLAPTEHPPGAEPDK
jgi:hypothetical protein